MLIIVYERGGSGSGGGGVDSGVRHGTSGTSADVPNVGLKMMSDCKLM